ncbi:MAG TPA: protocatechuate 3,4-dioxygenase [Alphaproteobacteria bacterium]|jgi:protocatechuate 4,5-dioxygenase alpha chain|nr:protocatechuate 3,4-dioxygenase [Alphaproteobacteria bacterium]
MSKKARALDTSGPAAAPTDTPYKDEVLPIKSRQIDYAHPLWGTYPTTGARAQRGYRLSKFCMSFMSPANREAFKADHERYMSDWGLSDYEKGLIRRQDWNGMLRYGVNTFMLLKLSATLGVGQNRTGAAMRGQSYEEFMATRNVKEAS